jgi:hypothetical protein
MVLERLAKPTLTPVELDHGDTLRFTLRDGTHWEMTLLQTSAQVTRRGHWPYHCKQHEHGDILAYAFDCVLRINGRDHQIRREVATAASFYQPLAIDGVQVWLDAALCIFAGPGGGFMVEKDWRRGQVCQPTRHARFAVQEQDVGICPEPIGPWFGGQTPHLDITRCYNGEDCWLGPYNGAPTHSGLDINMPAGTVLTAPISFDDHYLTHHPQAGFKCIRWRGVRHWPDGSQWWLQSHHLKEMLVPERGSLARGTAYATGAGTAVGLHPHSHFAWRILEQGGEYVLDPWIVLAATSW